MAEFNQFALDRGEAKELLYLIPGQDTTSWSLRWCLVTNQADDPAAALITMTQANSAVVRGSGFISVTLNTAQTDVTAGRYYHTLARTDARGMLAYGPIDVGGPDASG